MNVHVEHANDARDATSWRNFVRHLVEMSLAMLVGMAVLGGVVSLIFALLGHSNVLHFAGLRGALMTTYMIVGMTVWMRHRHHAWPRVGEMVAAMIVPYVLLIGPFEAGAISRAAFLGGMHILMLPAMVLAMLLRSHEYAEDHRHHAVASAPLRVSP